VEAVTALTSIAAPPWDTLRKWPVYRKWELKYQAKVETAGEVDIVASPAYASPEEVAQWHAADDFAFLHFVGMDLKGELMQVDLPALGTDFTIPIFMIQGEQDLTALLEIAKSYFNRIRAPRKEFYLVPGTGHESSAAELDLTLKVLTEQVRPLALEH
jgi:pimeloyl-ACP methyl ester carboxylesterase